MVNQALVSSFCQRGGQVGLSCNPSDSDRFIFRRFAMAQSIVANPDPKKVVARTGECLRLLLEAGLSFDDLQTPIDDPDFRQRLVTFWQRRAIVVEVQETDSQKAARDIMGRNFLGLPEVAQYYGDLSEEQTAALAEVPFSEDTLRTCAESHVLMADIGLSILDVRQKACKGLFYSQDWFNGEQFARETEKAACWRLIRKTPVDDSTSKAWNEQKKLIADTDEIPSARQVVYMIILNFLATGERLFETLYVRTSSVPSYCNRVLVGYFDRGGLTFSTTTTTSTGATTSMCRRPCVLGSPSLPAG